MLDCVVAPRALVRLIACLSCVLFINPLVLPSRLGPPFLSRTLSAIPPPRNPRSPFHTSLYPALFVTHQHGHGLREVHDFSLFVFSLLFCCTPLFEFSFISFLFPCVAVSPLRLSGTDQKQPPPTPDVDHLQPSSPPRIRFSKSQTHLRKIQPQPLQAEPEKLQAFKEYFIDVLLFVTE